MTTDAITVTDAGLETVLLFHERLDLPHFAAFPLLDDPSGRAAMRRYFAAFVAIADERGLPIVLDTPTWRANADWGARLGCDAGALARANAAAVAFVRELVDGRADALVEGAIGPRGDGYVVGERMTPDEAEAYHSAQVRSLRDAGADQVSAMTLTSADEAIGVVRAAAAAGIPIVPSFTVETDGRLPDGSELGDAIALVDAETDGAALTWMVNCAHPDHVAPGLARATPAVRDRIGALRVNASRQSHAELDAADELDAGDPTQLGADVAALRALVPHVRILGGCCGTDARHVAAIVDAWGSAPTP
ncbi:homocysteine S-methyltransferase family protein [Agrococcus jejuensis]|uniref:homocysteine S-methyltransferase family protein n=1 Tax=Agrococcus jejuensis TaxID=399736 RepID=UPI0011A721FA|nr:homocysteine S-methyltransferase family protein [Agrococcus jejuensis]